MTGRVPAVVREFTDPKKTCEGDAHRGPHRHSVEGIIAMADQFSEKIVGDWQALEFRFEGVPNAVNYRYAAEDSADLGVVLED